MRRDLDRLEARFQQAEHCDAETVVGAAGRVGAGADSVLVAARAYHLTVTVGKTGQEAYDRPQEVPLGVFQKLAKTFADFQALP